MKHWLMCPVLYTRKCKQIYFINTASHFVALAILEFDRCIRLAWNSQQSTCFCLVSNGIKGMYSYYYLILTLHFLPGFRDTRIFNTLVCVFSLAEFLLQLCLLWCLLNNTGNSWMCKPLPCTPALGLEACLIYHFYFRIPRPSSHPS